MSDVGFRLRRAYFIEFIAYEAKVKLKAREFRRISPGILLRYRSDAQVTLR